MARKDISALRDEAAEAVERGKLSRAVELYQELEELEPRSAAWPKRLGETHRRAGEAAAAVTAFERAAERYAQTGFMVQAIAVCKIILQLDPDNVAAVARLGALTPAPRARQATPATPAPPSPAPAPATIPPGSGLDALELASVVPGARKQLQPDGSESGIVVLPLDEELELIEVEVEVVPAPAPGPVLTPAARLALRRTPLFAELPPRALERLVPRMALLELSAGDVLFREGEPGASLFVISEGEVLVESGGNELARLGPGSFFGEISLVTDLPRSASVRATQPLELLGIDRALVRDAAAEQPEIINVLLRFVRDRLVDRMTRTSELFRPFADDDRETLSGKFELVEVVPGARLIVQGQRADGLYVMVAGRVDIARDGEPAPITQLGSGDVFGEMSLLSGGGSTANVTSASRVLALRMPARTFREVIMTHPQVLAYLGELADRRAPRADTGAFADLHLDLL